MIGTIRFEQRHGVASKDGKTPISLIYSIRGERKRFSTGLTIFKEYWDTLNQLASYIPIKVAKTLLPDVNPNLLLTELEIKRINFNLNDLCNNILAIEDRFRANNIEFTSQMVIDTLNSQRDQLTKKQEPTGLVFDFMDKYINEHEATREAGSLTVYKSVKNHLQAYQDETKHKVTFETIDYSFFNKFQSFLIKRTKTDKQGKTSPMLNNTTIAKALSTLKTFLGYARREGIKVNDSYRDFPIKKEKLEVIALEQNELDAIIKLDLTNNKRLEKARDLFVFSCSTGFRYSDVAQLRNEHISDNVITMIVKKTKTELTVPLNSISAAILDKYKDQAKPLPLISNQNLNYGVHDLCKLAGINKPIEIVRFSGKQRLENTYPKHELIHFHTGRKTFVTLSLEKGMSAEEVMTITGHTDYKSFKRYVNVTEKRKKLVMVKAWGAVSHLKAV